jgi:hypothetical protein
MIFPRNVLPPSSAFKSKLKNRRGDKDPDPENMDNTSFRNVESLMSAGSSSAFCLH